MEWVSFDNGSSVGKRGSEDGVIMRDDEHQDGARITLEKECVTAPFSVTCGIYGWMVHTRFFGEQTEAEENFEKMKENLANILNLIPLESEIDDEEKIDKVTNAISDFVEKYP